jgi:hypothetical protein
MDQPWKLVKFPCCRQLQSAVCDAILAEVLPNFDMLCIDCGASSTLFQGWGWSNPLKNSIMR